MRQLIWIGLTFRCCKIASGFKLFYVLLCKTRCANICLFPKDKKAHVMIKTCMCLYNIGTHLEFCLFYTVLKIISQEGYALQGPFFMFAMTLTSRYIGNFCLDVCLQVLQDSWKVSINAGFQKNHKRLNQENLLVILSPQVIPKFALTLDINSMTGQYDG